MDGLRSNENFPVRILHPPWRRHRVCCVFSPMGMNATVLAFFGTGLAAHAARNELTLPAGA
jgi:hypothetical protein